MGLNLGTAGPRDDAAMVWAEEPLVQAEPGECEPDYDPVTYQAWDGPS